MIYVAYQEISLILPHLNSTVVVNIALIFLHQKKLWTELTLHSVSTERVMHI